MGNSLENLRWSKLDAQSRQLVRSGLARIGRGRSANNTEVEDIRSRIDILQGTDK
jgi:hypothetical protein